ncbi:site-specific DNA-methyltransferase [Levilactobacillus brevis]|uniref:site-specific DNA-methyltransferase n=1 Tax=Levilactobacillus brevis TaxID=1580 RepID=UPI0021A3D8E1|nr:site-specific DNA-methyltransferase [Levilactobacillus brevis]MCT3582720.1 site-specific DNA-methyltransferase [Levilactobacillus brevis]
MEIEPKIMSQVKSILGEFGNKYLTSKGSLKRNNVINDLDKFDRELMTKLFKDPLIHKNYVEKIADTEVFRLNQFIEMFEYKEFWENSYTKYTNKIGLTANGKFIDESADVVLDFPFKDTVLKAGMTKEDLDKDESADEPFLNEIIAKPEIDELLEPKIFVNAKKYDQNGEHNASSYSDQDNLIIKGNNLIVLYSLKKLYASKIKLIYLDPPYNTGSDSFLYNDKFNQSSWLTFMKNRLEIAHQLLSDDGVIAIQLDDSEGPYLKVLMDSVFGKDNELFTQYVLVRYADKTLKSDMDYHKQVEQIHFYKNNSQVKVHPNKQEEQYDYSKFNFKISTVGPPMNTVILGGKRVEIFKSDQTRIRKIEGSSTGLKEIWATGTILNGNSSGRFFRDYLNGRYKTDGYGIVYKVYGIGNDDNEFRFFTGPKKQGATKGKYYQGVPLDVLSGKITSKKKPIPGFIDMAGAFGNDRLEGGVGLRNGKKPEQLLEEIIKIFSKENDYILDFFSGSGSTAAVSTKMRRKFIAVEQIDEQIEKMVKRLNNVIQGDQTGISKDVDWQGGGSFVYAELMEKNQGYLKDLLAAKDINELDDVYKRMKVGADFDFRVDLDKYENDAERKALPFEEQKQLLVKLLDKNQLYYNFNNIDDADVRDLISDKDYQFNQSFYGKRD